MLSSPCKSRIQLGSLHRRCGAPFYLWGVPPARSRLRCPTETPEVCEVQSPSKSSSYLVSDRHVLNGSVGDPWGFRRSEHDNSFCPIGCKVWSSGFRSLPRVAAAHLAHRRGSYALRFSIPKRPSTGTYRRREENFLLRRRHLGIASSSLPDAAAGRFRHQIR